MEYVRKWKERNSEKGEKFKQMQEDERLQTMLEERKKSSAQRELERHYKDKQEEAYKAAVDKLHQQQTKESWKGKQIFQGHKNIMKSEKNILDNDRKGVLEKSMFLDNRNKIAAKEALFFKW
jgi:hypothetical protein